MPGYSSMRKRLSVTIARVPEHGGENHADPADTAALRPRMTRLMRSLVAPPYAREISAALASRNVRDYWGTSPDGKHPCLWLLVGPHAWRQARTWRPFRLVTLLPPDSDPELLNWAVLTGLDPVLMLRCGDVPGDVVRALIAAVMRDGAERIIDVITGTRYVCEEVAA